LHELRGRRKEGKSGSGIAMAFEGEEEKRVENFWLGLDGKKM
jgi:hypothetical protein